MLNKNELLGGKHANNWNRTYGYPFTADDFITDFSHFIANNWTLNASKQCLQSPYLSDSQSSTVYVKIHTPKFPIYLDVACYASCENSFDKGTVSYSTTQGLNVGTNFCTSTGNNTAPSTYTTKLPADTDLYINFGYQTDSSNLSYDNRFYVYSMTFYAAPEVTAPRWSKKVGMAHAPHVATRGVHLKAAKAWSNFNLFYNHSYGGATEFPPGEAFCVYINKEPTTQYYRSITCAAGDDVLIKLIDEKKYWYPQLSEYYTNNAAIEAILDPYPLMYKSKGVQATDWNRSMQGCTALKSVHKYYLCNNPQMTIVSYMFWNNAYHEVPSPIYFNATGITQATQWLYNATNVSSVQAYCITGSSTASTIRSNGGQVLNWDGDLSDSVLP